MPFEKIAAAFRVPEIRQRLIFTFVLLIVSRILAHVPLPGVNLVLVRQLFSNNTTFSMLNLFVGGGFRSFSAASLSVYPYVTATIVIQVATQVFPRLQEMSKDGASGRAKIALIGLWLTIPVTLLQAYGTLALLASQGVVSNFGLLDHPIDTLMMLATLLGGTLALIWLAEMITEGGLGNGLSVLIFANIVANLPGVIAQNLAKEQNFPTMVAYGGIAVLTLVAIVAMEEAHLRIPIQYARRMRGGQVLAGGHSHLPIRLNPSGMIPLLFAVSFFLFPPTVSNLLRGMKSTFATQLADWVSALANPGDFWYWLTYFGLVVFFSFVYAAIVFQQQDLAENLQRNGGYIPGIRPGQATNDYLSGVITRATLVGAMALGAIAVLPGLLSGGTNSNLAVSSSAIIIVVGVVIDLIRQLNAQLSIRRLGGFLDES